MIVFFDFGTVLKPVRRPCLQPNQNKKTRFYLARLRFLLKKKISLNIALEVFASSRVALHTSGGHDFRPDLRGGLRGRTAGLKLAGL